MPLPPEVIWKIIAGIAAVEAALMAMLVAMVRTTARATQAGGRGGLVVAFYHPRCTGGGGGERVLWKMVQVLSEYAAGAGAGAGAGADDTDDGDDDDDGGPKKNKNGSSGVIEQVVIYTTDAPTETYARDVYRHVRERFALELPEQTLNLRFVHLDEYADYLVPSKRFSLLAEGWNTMRLAFLALQLTLRSDGLLTVPHVWIDTTGAAFTYLPARVLFGCCVLAYVHYPTISTDMLRRVWQTRRRSGDAYDTSSTSTILSLVKCVYYVFFAILYGAVGSLSSLVLTNSTWTYNHIRSLWKYAAWRDRIRIVYPPCRLLESSDNKDEDSKETIAKPREPAIVSIGQFRPEKDHALQLEAMARLLKQHPEWKHKKGCKLVLIGSCRSGEADDQARLEKLRTMAKQLGIEEYVEFVVNQPFAVVQEWLLRGSVGIHTMWNEHFGIAVVESMAAGQIMVAHDSGGPQSDIVVPFQGKPTGFLATTADEYAERIHEILSMSETEASQIRRDAQMSAQRFTDEVFAESFRRAMIELNLIGTTSEPATTKDSR